MKRVTSILFLLFLVSTLALAGCALLNKAAPSQIDANGNVIPGTHQATPVVQGAADLLPHGIGSAILGAFLLAWNGYEKYKAAKSAKGLKATLMALNQVKNDPALKADWDKIKEILSNNHSVAGVQPMINKTLANL